MINFNGAGRARDAGVPDGAARQARRAGVLQPLRRRLGARDEHALPVDQAGRLALGRHAQRHHRALAERASRPRARSARSSTTSSTSRRRSSKRPGFPQPIVGRTACSRARSKASACSTRFNDAKAAERHETQYFEMFGNRGIYHKGWTAVTRHKTPWLLVGEKTAGLRRRRLGALRHQQGLEPGERPGQGDAGEAARAAAAVADRGDALQRAAARRPRRRADELRIWPAGRC